MSGCTAFEATVPVLDVAHLVAEPLITCGEALLMKQAGCVLAAPECTSPLMEQMLL